MYVDCSDEAQRIDRHLRNIRQLQLECLTRGKKYMCCIVAKMYTYVYVCMYVCMYVCTGL